MDTLCRERGGWTETQMAYACEVLGNADDPQVLMTGADGVWMPRAKRWNFTGKREVRAVILLSEYRAALSVKATGSAVMS